MASLRCPSGEWPRREREGPFIEQSGRIASLLHDGSDGINGDTSGVEVDNEAAIEPVDVNAYYSIYLLQGSADESGAVSAGSVSEVEICSTHFTVSFENDPDQLWSGY